MPFILTNNKTKHKNIYYEVYTFVEINFLHIVILNIYLNST